MNRYLISCDWGTTNLRVKWVDCSSGEVLDQAESDQGISKVYSEWLGHPNEDRVRYYLNLLKSVVGKLDHSQENLTDIPIVISGMASSSIGMVELPYSETPSPLNGNDLVVHHIPPTAFFNNPVWLISGLRHGDDVLRGEETQIVGLAQLNYDLKNSLIVMPGTHSKHVEVKEGIIQGFKTYMTGELFQVVSSYTILKDSVQKPTGSITEVYEEAFQEGVTVGQTTALANSLFKVRTNQLFGRYDPGQNYYFLSGLLIGAELREIKNHNSIVFCGGHIINQFYRIATDTLRLSSTSYFVSDQEAQILATNGHLALIERLSEIGI